MTYVLELRHPMGLWHPVLNSCPASLKCSRVEDSDEYKVLQGITSVELLLYSLGPKGFDFLVFSINSPRKSGDEPLLTTDDVCWYESTMSHI